MLRRIKKLKPWALKKFCRHPPDQSALFVRQVLKLVSNFTLLAFFSFIVLLSSWSSRHKTFVAIWPNLYKLRTSPLTISFMGVRVIYWWMIQSNLIKRQSAINMTLNYSLCLLKCRLQTIWNLISQCCHCTSSSVSLGDICLHTQLHNRPLRSPWGKFCQTDRCYSEVKAREILSLLVSSKIGIPNWNPIFASQELELQIGSPFLCLVIAHPFLNNLRNWCNRLWKEISRKKFDLD